MIYVHVFICVTLLVFRVMGTCVHVFMCVDFVKIVMGTCVHVCMCVTLLVLIVMGADITCDKNKVL